MHVGSFIGYARLIKKLTGERYVCNTHLGLICCVLTEYAIKNNN